MVEFELESSEQEKKGKEKIVELEKPISEKIIPKAGLVFNSKEEVYSLYVEYA